MVFVEKLLRATAQILVPALILEPTLLAASIEGNLCQPKSGPFVVAPVSNGLIAQQTRPGAAAAPGESQEDAEERSQHTEGLDNSRVSLENPDGDALLGNQMKIVMHVAPGRITTVLYQQAEGNRVIESGVAKFHAEGDGSGTVQIVPQELGPVQLTISVVYLDNVNVHQTIKLNVQPTEKGPKKFELNQGLPEVTLTLDGGDNERIWYLRPFVEYEGIVGSLSLRDHLPSIELNVTQDEAVPVIRLDKETGAVTALKAGEAVVLGKFAGKTDVVRFIVTEKR